MEEVLKDIRALLLIERAKQFLVVQNPDDPGQVAWNAALATALEDVAAVRAFIDRQRSG